ncbi:MAG: tRNA pseudouridine(38-40) synthase TruA [Stackebrandtia sp.]
MVRLRLDISYDGTDFHGWAVQPGQRTVCADVTTALGRLFDLPDKLTVAGRTDAGVHAAGQVVHVDVPAEQWELYADKLLWRLRGILPPDVRVTGAREVGDAFDARFSALWRRYAYRVSDAEWGVSPLRRRDILAWPRRLDVDAMNAAARALLGEHDFAAFCKRREGATTVRTLRRLEWRCDAEATLRADVVADAFCHSMVRSLVGAMIAVGEGRKDAAWLAALTTRGERANDFAVAPAHGLTLVEVGYPDDPQEQARRQTQTRRRRDGDLNPPDSP